MTHGIYGSLLQVRLKSEGSQSCWNGDCSLWLDRAAVILRNVQPHEFSYCTQAIRGESESPSFRPGPEVLTAISMSNSRTNPHDLFYFPLSSIPAIQSLTLFTQVLGSCVGFCGAIPCCPFPNPFKVCPGLVLLHISVGANSRHRKSNRVRALGL